MNESLILPVQIAAHAGSERAGATFLQEVAGRALTYREVHESAQRWAAALLATGLAPGERVGLMVPTTAESVELWLGIGWAQGIEVPVNTAFHTRMLSYVIRNCGAGTLIFDASFAPLLAPIAGELTDVRQVVILGETEVALPWPTFSREEFLALGDPRPELATPRASDIASIMYTSGTTGPSKGVRVPWGQCLATSQGPWPAEAITADDIFYSPFPMFHISGKNDVHVMASAGGQVVLREVFSTRDFWSDIADYRCTATLLLGAMANFVYRQPDRPDDAATPLAKVSMIPLIPGIKGFAERFGVRICTTFNMTETSCPVATGWDPPNDTTCGYRRDGYTIRLVDDLDQEVPVGEVGEMLIRTDAPWTQMDGYHNMPEATVAAWRNNWLHTGDLFRLDADGNYYFLERKKDAIRRRGENISSYEVENVVNEHPAVLESAAVAVPSEWGEDEVLVAVVAKPGHEVDPGELSRFLADRLPKFMLPRYIRPMAELPKTPTQKIQKVEIRKAGVDERTWDRGTPGR